MKKFLLVVVAAMFATGTFAQDWSAGLRVGSGLQAVGQYQVDSNNYVEGRLGMSWANYGGDLTVDFTALYNWNLADFDWTPSVGAWFLDAGAGINVGGVSNYAYVGVALMARLGIKFNNAPFSLSIDWTPTFGPEIFYYKGDSAADFHAHGLANLGLTGTFYF